MHNNPAEALHLNEESSHSFTFSPLTTPRAKHSSMRTLSPGFSEEDLEPLRVEVLKWGNGRDARAGSSELAVSRFCAFFSPWFSKAPNARNHVFVAMKPLCFMGGRVSGTAVVLFLTLKHEVCVKHPHCVDRSCRYLVLRAGVLDAI